jgi:hypothetical protein
MLAMLHNYHFNRLGDDSGWVLPGAHGLLANFPVQKIPIYNVNGRVTWTQSWQILKMSIRICRSAQLVSHLDEL